MKITPAKLPDKQQIFCYSGSHNSHTQRCNTTWDCQSFAGGHKKHYEETSSSQVNDCDNGKLPLNVDCQNTTSQIQGDENVVSQAAEHGFPEDEA
jgi:hypothetical protein